MRLRNLLYERDYNEDLRSEVITLLTAVSAEGISEINTANLLNDLAQQGFAIDMVSLIDLLNTMEIVGSASSDTISISTGDNPEDAEPTGEFKKDRVSDMATSKATKDIGEGIDDMAEYKVGDEIITTGESATGKDYIGDTGRIVAVLSRPNFYSVDMYNSGRDVYNASAIEANEYAGGDDEEMHMADNDPDYEPDLDEAADDDNDPAAQYRAMGTADLMAKKNYGLGKQREFARDELARRASAGDKWKWDSDVTKESSMTNESITRMQKLAGIDSTKKKL